MPEHLRGVQHDLAPPCEHCGGIGMIGRPLDDDPGAFCLDCRGTGRAHDGNLSYHGAPIIRDKADGWIVLAHRIDEAYGRDPHPSADIRNYYYCGKRLDSMTRDEVILALTKFKIPTDGIK